MTSADTKIEQLIQQGRYLEARTLAEQFLSEKKDLKVQQLYAITLSRSGALDSALSLLNPIYKENPKNTETVGILGGVYKQLFRKTQDSSYAILSREVYLKNFIETKSYYPGINAAAMSAISGKLKQARRLAGEIIELLDRTASEEASDDFWQLATRGEAYLLLRDRTSAVESYFKARKIAGNNWGWIGSVYHQLWLLNHYVPVPPEIMRVFSPPGVAAFVGHMIDHPNRKNKRFPAEIEGNAWEAIRAAIQTLNVKVGYSSLACGGDILFAECLGEAGGEINFILPFKKSDFIQTSIQFAGDDWRKRFEKLCDTYPVNFITNESYDNNDELFHFLGKVIFGEAVLRSQLMLNEPSLITLLSEFDLTSLKGGTRDVKKLWPYPDNHININPDQYVASITADAAEDYKLASTPPEVQSEPIKKIRRLAYMLIADFEQGTSEGLKFELEEKASHVEGVIQFTQEDHHFVFGSASVPVIMELFSVITKSLPHSMRPFMKISLQVESLPLHSDEDQYDIDYNFIVPISIHAKLAYGETYATDSFAALLVLDQQDYLFDFVGEVQVLDDQIKRAIYKVEKT